MGQITEYDLWLIGDFCDSFMKSQIIVFEVTHHKLHHNFFGNLTSQIILHSPKMMWSALCCKYCMQILHGLILPLITRQKMTPILDTTIVVEHCNDYSTSILCFSLPSYFGSFYCWFMRERRGSSALLVLAQWWYIYYPFVDSSYLFSWTVVNADYYHIRT